MILQPQLTPEGFDLGPKGAVTHKDETSPFISGLVALNPTCETTNQVQLVLDRLQTPNRPHEPIIRTVEGHTRESAVTPCPRKTANINAIADSRHPPAAYAHPLSQIVFQMSRKSDVMADEWRIGFSHKPMAAALSRWIRSIPSMLAVQPNRNPRSPSWHGHFQCSQIASMNNIRPQAPEQRKNCWIQFHAVAGLLVELEKRDLLASNTAMKCGIPIGQRNQNVPIAINWHMVDQIDNAIFQPTDAKTIHNVGNQWTAAWGHTAPPMARFDSNKSPK